MKKKLAVILAAVLTFNTLAVPVLADDEFIDAAPDAGEEIVVGTEEEATVDGSDDFEIVTDGEEEEYFEDFGEESFNEDAVFDAVGEELVEEGFEESAEDLADDEHSEDQTVDPTIQHEKEAFWDFDEFPPIDKEGYGIIKGGMYRNLDGTYKYYYLLDKEGNKICENEKGEIETEKDIDPTEIEQEFVIVQVAPTFSKDVNKFCLDGGIFMYPCQHNDGTQYRYDNDGNVIGRQWHEDFIRIRDHVEGDPEDEEVEDDYQAPTCTEDGSKTTHIHTTVSCENCNIVLDEDDTDPVTVTLRHTGHKFFKKVVDTEPTCLEDGEYHYVCTVCGADDTDEGHTGVIPALGHDWDDGEITPQTCIDDGYITYTCERCGETKVEYPDWLKADGESHDWDETLVIKAPTCTTTGNGRHWCKLCGDKEDFVLEALGHNYEYTEREWLDCYSSRDVYLCTRCHADAIDNNGTEPVYDADWDVVWTDQDDIEEYLEELGIDPYYYVEHKFDKGHTHNVDDDRDFGEPDLYKAATCTLAGIKAWYCDFVDNDEVVACAGYAKNVPVGTTVTDLHNDFDELYDFDQTTGLDRQEEVVIDDGIVEQDGDNVVDDGEIHYTVTQALGHEYPEDGGWVLRYDVNEFGNEYGYWVRQCTRVNDVKNTPYDETDDVECDFVDERISKTTPTEEKAALDLEGEIWDLPKTQPVAGTKNKNKKSGASKEATVEEVSSLGLKYYDPEEVKAVKAKYDALNDAQKELISDEAKEILAAAVAAVEAAEKALADAESKTAESSYDEIDKAKKDVEDAKAGMTKAQYDAAMDMLSGLVSEKEASAEEAIQKAEDLGPDSTDEEIQEAKQDVEDNKDNMTPEEYEAAKEAIADAEAAKAEKERAEKAQQIIEEAQKLNADSTDAEIQAVKDKIAAADMTDTEKANANAAVAAAEEAKAAKEAAEKEAARAAAAQAIIEEAQKLNADSTPAEIQAVKDKIAAADMTDTEKANANAAVAAAEDAKAAKEAAEKEAARAAAAQAIIEEAQKLNADSTPAEIQAVKDKIAAADLTDAEKANANAAVAAAEAAKAAKEAEAKRSAAAQAIIEEAQKLNADSTPAEIQAVKDKIAAADMTDAEKAAANAAVSKAEADKAAKEAAAKEAARAAAAQAIIEEAQKLNADSTDAQIKAVKDKIAAADMNNAEKAAANAAVSKAEADKAAKAQKAIEDAKTAMYKALEGIPASIDASAATKAKIDSAQAAVDSAKKASVPAADTNAAQAKVNAAKTAYNNAVAQANVKITFGNSKVTKNLSESGLTTKRIKIKKGKKFKLKAKSSTGATIYYKSNNYKILSVSKSGVVKAKKKGKASIYVMCGDKHVRVRFTVK